MRVGTEELRERVADGDAMLREAGSTFLEGLDQLQDLRRVESSVAASCQVQLLTVDWASSTEARGWGSFVTVRKREMSTERSSSIPGVIKNL